MRVSRHARLWQLGNQLHNRRKLYRAPSPPVPTIWEYSIYSSLSPDFPIGEIINRNGAASNKFLTACQRYDDVGQSGALSAILRCFLVIQDAAYRQHCTAYSRAVRVLTVPRHPTRQCRLLLLQNLVQAPWCATLTRSRQKDAAGFACSPAPEGRAAHASRIIRTAARCAATVRKPRVDLERQLVVRLVSRRIRDGVVRATGGVHLPPSP